MKKIKTITFIATLFFIYQNSFAQRDIIYKNDSTQIRCKILKVTGDKYEYVFADLANKVFKTKILKTLVDSVNYNFYDSNLVQNKIFTKRTKPVTEEIIPLQKNWKLTLGVGLNVESIIELNNPFGSDKKSLSGTCAIDAGANYSKEGSRFTITNEVHYIFGLQKSGFISANHLQRVADEINFMQDLSLAIGKTQKWNFNVIAKSATSFFTIYDGEYFKDYTSMGKAKAFLSPYDVTISPGIKWQPNKYLRISISPYSFNLYGVKNLQISAKGIFITDMDASGNYKRNLFKRLGAEVNIWYDRQFRKWLDVQYRFGISSNYFEKIAKNGLVDGLFITRAKLVKDLYLTHRATFKGDFSMSPFKPYYNQSLLLSYSRNF
ncbi:hypothetical protein [Ferruginibacter sp.]|nr:hypothetical protein [Ferruginibacter sp.]